MTFLALTPLQVALLCGLTAATVIVLFFLKLRHPRVAVASLLLWERVLHDRQHRSLLERLRRLLSLLLALTIALLIALALGRPEASAITGAPRESVIVLDTSITMAARTADNQSRWDHARDAATRLIESAGGNDRFLLADTSGRVATAMTTDRVQLDAALERMTPSAIRPVFPQVDVSGREVIVVSDGIAALDLPRTARVLSVFEPADNVAIADFTVVARAGEREGYDGRLVITNHSLESKYIRLTIEDSSEVGFIENVTVNGRDTIVRTVALSGNPVGVIRARVTTDEDVLAVDDEAIDYLPPTRDTTVALVTAGNEFLETLLGLDGRVDLRVISPDVYNGNEAVDLYVFDEFAPSIQPRHPALLFRPPGRPWLAASDLTPPLRASAIEVTNWDETHPILEHVSMLDVRITAARHLEFASTSPATRILASGGQTPLVVVNSAVPKWVAVNFALDDSDFPVHPGFPIFMQNVLTWFVGDRLPLRRSVGTVDVPLSDATVATINGVDLATWSRLGSTSFEAPVPGLYVASAGAARTYVAVNLPAGLSDVNGVTLTGRENIAWETGWWLSGELWKYLLGLALVLVVFEWWTYHRRITV